MATGGDWKRQGPKNAKEMPYDYGDSSTDAPMDFGSEAATASITPS